MKHTLQVLKNVNYLSQEHGLGDDDRMMMNMTAMFHDLGKLDPRSHKVKPDGYVGYSGDPNNPEMMAHEHSSAEQWMIFADAMGLSNIEKETIHELVSSHMKPMQHVEDEGTVSDKQLRHYLRKNPSWVFQYIHSMADALSKDYDPNLSVLDPFKANMERMHQLGPQQDQPPAQDLLNGGEIIEIVGLPAKPPPGLPGYIEVVKERIREMQDENPNITKEDAVTFVRGLIPELQQMYTQASNWLQYILKK